MESAIKKTQDHTIPESIAAAPTLMPPTPVKSIVTSRCDGAAAACAALCSESKGCTFEEQIPPTKNLGVSFPTRSTQNVFSFFSYHDGGSILVRKGTFTRGGLIRDRNEIQRLRSDSVKRMYF